MILLMYQGQALVLCTQMTAETTQITSTESSVAEINQIFCYITGAQPQAIVQVLALLQPKGQIYCVNRDISRLGHKAQRVASML